MTRSNSRTRSSCSSRLSRPAASPSATTTQTRCGCRATSASPSYTRGRAAKGIQLIKATADARTQVLGPDHPDTLTALNALAVAHRLTGNPDKALETAKRVVLARSRALGPTHADTLTSRMGLGLALAAAGETANAHRIVDKTLADAREALGVDDDHYLALVDCGFDSGLLQADFT